METTGPKKVSWEILETGTDSLSLHGKRDNISSKILFFEDYISSTKFKQKMMVSEVTHSMTMWYMLILLDWPGIQTRVAEVKSNVLANWQHHAIPGNRVPVLSHRRNVLCISHPNNYRLVTADVRTTCWVSKSSSIPTDLVEQLLHICTFALHSLF